MKIILILQISLLMILSACSYDESLQVSEMESSLEMLAVETTAKLTETVTVTVTTSSAIINRSKQLNLGKIDKWSFNSRSKFFYFTDYGRYYPVETSGFEDKDYENACNDLSGHDAIYNLCLDNGNEKTVLDNTENCMSYYCDGNSIYIYKYDSNNNGGIYKLYKDGLTKLTDSPDKGYISAVCFTSEHIYYSIFDEKKSSVYQMDYNGDNIEHIFNNPTKIWNMVVYNKKIWFERSFDMYQIHGLAYFDIKTANSRELKENHLGYINNNYMYYSEGKSLYRVNLSDFECESIINIDSYLMSFDFYEKYILYSSGDFLYKYSDNENTPIFSVQDYFEDESYRIREIQCQDNRIFIKIGSGAFYQCIMEIDIDGNIIELIHED